ncbi:MAG TPA: SoxY-related AACIE arm protein [Xanthobacteraceae bacterium]
MTDQRANDSGTSRRDFLTATVTLAGGMALASVARPARATPDTMQAAIREVVGEAAIRKGKVKIDVPPLVENGNTVPITISVDSPMTAADHVKSIHLFNEKNPQPNVIGVHLGPRAGKAQFSTRIKLAAAQTIIAVAQLSDGSFWSDDADVIVTIAACVEDLQ